MKEENWPIKSNMRSHVNFLKFDCKLVDFVHLSLVSICVSDMPGTCPRQCLVHSTLDLLCLGYFKAIFQQLGKFLHSHYEIFRSTGTRRLLD